MRSTECPYSLFCSHRSPATLSEIVNTELRFVFHWIQANKLSLHTHKTNFMLFRNSISSLPDQVLITSRSVIQVDSPKLIGVYNIESQLSWKV